MNRISKKLTNVIILKDESNKIKDFVEEVKSKGIKVYSVKCTKNLKEITTNFVDKNWNISDWNLIDKVMYGKINANQSVIAFGDDDLQHILLRLISKYGITATYKYVVEYENGSKIITEMYVDGVNFAEDEISSIFKTNKYTIAKCFA